MLTPFAPDAEHPFAAHLAVWPLFTPAKLARKLEALGYRRDAAEDAGVVYGATHP